MNIFIVIGNLTADPVSKVTASGKRFTKFRIAQDSRRGTQYWNVVTFDKLAETMGDYLQKGSMVQVVGEQQEREYKDGQGITHRILECTATEVKFLDRIKSREQVEAEANPA